MIFTDPSIEEVYKIILNNDEIINFLKNEKIIVTKKELEKNYTKEEVENLLPFTFTSNVNTIYDIARVLIKYKEEIKSKSILELLSNADLKNDLAESVGIPYEYLEIDVYQHILYTYKYCYISSFFQNNKKTFLPENDFFELENNPAALSFYDAMMKEFDKMDSILDTCTDYLDYDKIPWDLINYITQLLGFEKSLYDFEDKDEIKIRELVKNILDLYRIKGTNYSFELFFNFLGYNIKISEYYFDRRLYYLNSRNNKETDKTDKTEYEFYLTTINPENNDQDISINEIVMPSDISPQYSLNEFEELAKTYGPEAVLGYSSHYFDSKDSKWKKYEGKVYKYFKTNMVYYDISLPGESISNDKWNSIIKCLNFFTPSYVLRRATTLKGDVYSYKDILSFNGDGSKTFDENKGYGEIEILDGEDWDTYGQDYVVKFDEKTGQWFNKKGGGLYQNSLVKLNSSEDRKKAANKYKLPIDYKFENISLSKYLTNKTGAPVLKRKRIKFYLDKKDGSNKLYPYYTVPPKIKDIDNIEEKDLRFVEENVPAANLIGGNSLKEKIRESGKTIKVETINKINEELEPVELLSARDLVFVFSLPYDNEEQLNNLNLPFDFSTDEYYSKEKLENYNNYPEVCKKLIYGKYVKAKDDNNVYIYRYGNLKFPSKDSEGHFNINNPEYKKYKESFLYDPVVISNVNYKTLYSITPISLENIGKIKEDMNNKKDLNEDPDYVSKLFYYSEEDKKYYKASKIINPNCVKIFSNGNFLNKEYIEKDVAYIYKYKDNRKENQIYYNEEDGKFYKVNSNLEYKELTDFYGRLEKKGNSYYIYQYDECWEGYDEEADNEDFLGYNNSHKIYWPELGYNNSIEGRPIKEKLDITNNKKVLFDEVYSKSFGSFWLNEKDEILDIINKGVEDPFENISDFLESEMDLEKVYNNIIEKIDAIIEEKKLANNSIDEYGRYLNCYIFAKNFTNSMLDNKGKYSNFIKDYYYRKLVSLYRYRLLDDNGKIDLITKERNPMFVYPKVINSLISTYNNNLTNQNMLQTSYINNGLNKEPIKIPFKGIKIINNKLIIEISINEDYIKKVGFVFNKDTNVKDFIKPVFFYNSSSNDWHNVRRLSKLYNNFYFTESSTKKTGTISLDIGFYSPNENYNDLEGYLEYRNFSQSLLDTVVSVPESYKDYLSKEEIYGRIDQFISFGDDREINYYLKYKPNSGIDCNVFVNKQGKITIKVPKKTNNGEDTKINRDVKFVKLS